VFEEIGGLPLHPLLIHAAVVFIPLLTITAIAYALVPFVRPHVRWVLVALALIAPGSALFAKLSGDAFFKRGVERQQITEGFVPVIEEHQSFGTTTALWTYLLAALTLVLVYLVAPRAVATGAAMTASGPAWRNSPVLRWIMAVLVTVVGVISVYYVYRTGDSGAKAVWEGR
jgi:hypothetical protein